MHYEGKGSYLNPKVYNFQPEIWEPGSTPPEHLRTSINALNREKSLKFQLTDNMRDYKKFSKTIKKNKAERVKSVKRPQYDKRTEKMRRKKRRPQIPEEGVLRPDLDNAVRARPATIEARRTEYLNKYNIPVYENREKAKMNLVRTEIVSKKAKRDKKKSYMANKKAKKIVKAAHFSSLYKRKRKNEILKNDLMVDVKAQKRQQVINERLNNASDGSEDSDEFLESELEASYEGIRQKAEKQRKLMHEGTRKFIMDERKADELIKNILDIGKKHISKIKPKSPKTKKSNSSAKVIRTGHAGGSALTHDPYGPSIPTSSKLKANFQQSMQTQKFRKKMLGRQKKHKKELDKREEQRFKLDQRFFAYDEPSTSPKAAKPKTRAAVFLNNFVLQSSKAFASRVKTNKKNNDNKLRKDIKEMKLQQVPSRNIEKLFTRKKHRVKVQDVKVDLAATGKGWSKLKNKKKRLEMLQRELNPEKAKKFVDGVLRYQSVSDLIKDLDKAEELMERSRRPEDRQLMKEYAREIEEERRQDEEGEMDLSDVESVGSADSGEEEGAEEGEEEEDEVVESEGEDVQSGGYGEEEELSDSVGRENVEMGVFEGEDVTIEDGEEEEDDSGLNRMLEPGFGYNEESVAPKIKKGGQGMQRGGKEDYDGGEEEEGEEEVSKTEPSAQMLPLWREEEETGQNAFYSPTQQPKDKAQKGASKKSKATRNHKKSRKKSISTPREEIQDVVPQPLKVKQPLSKTMIEGMLETHKRFKEPIKSIESKIQENRQKLNQLNQARQMEVERFAELQAAQRQQFMSDMRIPVVKKRISYGLDRINRIKNKVTGIDMDKAIELKKSYDAMKRKFLHKEMELRYEINDLERIKQGLDIKDGSDPEKNLKMMLEDVGGEEEGLDGDNDQNLEEKEDDGLGSGLGQKHGLELSVEDREYILNRLIHGEDDLGARQVNSHPWIDFDD